MDKNDPWRFSINGMFRDVYFSEFKEDTWHIGGSGNYFLTNWLEIGIETEYFYSREESYFEESYYSDRDEFRIGPIITLYVPNSTIIKPFMDVSVGYAHQDLAVGNDYERYDKIVDNAGTYWKTGIGARTFFIDQASLDLRFSYGEHIWKQSVGGPEERFNIDIGISIYF